MRFFKHGLTVALVFAVTLTVVGCSDSAKKEVKLPEGVAASVNGKNITVADIDERVERQINANPSIMATKDQAMAKENLKAQALEDIINMSITLGEADKKGIEITDKEYDTDLKDLMKKNGIKNEESLRKILKDKKISYESFKKDYIERAKIKKLADVLTKGLKVTDKEVETYYKKNKASFDTPVQVKVQHILVDDLKKANEVLSKLKKGEDLGELAASYSTDPGSKTNKGIYDLAPVTQYVPEFKEACLSLKIGEYTKKPVKTDYGYHIVKLLDKKEGKESKFAEVKKEIQTNLLEEKKNKFLDDWIKKQRDASKVVKAQVSPVTTPSTAGVPQPLPQTQGSPSDVGK
jgi:foldase protein PrsA